ncbi:MAG: aminotransferase class V-fold PLP-dependent enzyme [Chloroflexi bacterium]|nr:aminotransferase class V-fold PLP-dependent enzyme [Chloroflexota bacterium]MCL5107643.1 aminotransferase class V-fold PLP-dependent enzyme [Chloroflexota bacterium]
MNEQRQAAPDIAVLRRALPVLERVVYLNTGTAGIAAAPVLRRLWEEVALFETEGEVRYHEMQERMEAGRGRVAALVGAEADEIAFTRNATDGVDLVAWGIQWREGDEVIISDQEHPAMNHPWFYLQARGGPKVKMFAVEPDPEATLRNVRALITSRTRLIASSHVSCQTGIRVPAKDLCALAAEHGLLIFLDGAQAVGQFPVDVKALGCDFYASNGHKWLHGPKGTGFLYLRRDRLDAVRPTHVGAGSFVRPVDLDDIRLMPSAHRYEYGTRGYGAYAALPAAVDYLAGLGWDWLEQRLANLSTYLKVRLPEVPNLTLLTPRSWDLSSALVSFTVAGRTSQEMADFLWHTSKIRSRTFPDKAILRVSTAYFNTEEELDLLLAAMRQMVGR